MQSSSPTSVTVAGACQIAAFAHPLRVRVLMACAPAERSLSALSDVLGAPLATLHYHVARLVAAELLAVSRTQRRAGRAIRFYRAVGDSFIVPHDDLAVAPGDALAARLRRALRDERIRGGEPALRYTPAADGAMRVELVPPEPAAPPRGFELWRVVALDASQRAALASDLAAVIDRFAAAPPRPGAATCLVHAAFAPRLDD